MAPQKGTTPPPAEPVITDGPDGAQAEASTFKIDDPTPMEVVRGLFREAVGQRSAEEVTEEILQAILSAETPEEVLAGGAAMHAEDYLDTPFLLMGFKEAAGEFGFFALLDIVDFRTGEMFRLTCGSQFVLTQLVRLRELNSFPRPAQMIQRVTNFEDPETGAKRRVLRLISASPPEQIAEAAARMLKTGEPVAAHA